MNNRRLNTRWQVNLQSQLGVHEAQAPCSCRLCDINFKGAQVALMTLLPEDKFLQLRIQVSSDCNFEVQAWVAWHKNISGVNHYGLYFTKMHDVDKEKLYRFIHRYFPEQLYQRWWRGVDASQGGECMDDRRIFARFAVDFPVGLLDPHQDQEEVAQACNISAKGLALISQKEIAPKTPLELWLQIPDQQEPLYTRGEVTWVQKEGEARYRMGINLEKADLMGFSRVFRRT